MAAQSAHSRRAAPVSAEAGMRYLAEFPTSLRAIWGATRPTNPIVPVKQDMTAVMRDSTIIATVLMRDASSPRAVHILSSREAMSNLLPMTTREVVPAIMAVRVNGTLSHSAFPRVPTFHS